MSPIFTIGHSTRSVGKFTDLLRRNGVNLLVDVRSYPTSRHCPQFNRDAIPGWLAPIEYRHLPELGGRRGKQPGFHANTWWGHPSFRNYADYAESAEFTAGIEALVALSRRYTMAYMCSEAVWWKCHRRIITDYLLIRGIEVVHILEDRNEAAALSSGAVRFGPALRYPGPVSAQINLFDLDSFSDPALAA